jgi:hypothetical protein
MKISRNFTLVLFLGAVAVIFFGMILMRGHKNANRVSSANQPFNPFTTPQQGDNMETPRYVPVASVDAPTGVATSLPFGLMKKLTVRVPFTAQYHIDVSSKYSTGGYTYQQYGSFMPHPTQEAQTYEGLYALDGNNITIKEDDARDNYHHVYTLKDNVSYERVKNKRDNNTCVTKVYGNSSWNPNFDLCNYPSFWISVHFPSSPEVRILKQNRKYIYTNVIWKNGENDYTIEIVDGAPRLSSIVNRIRFFDNTPWYVEKKEFFSNFTKVGGAWLPRSISITTYDIVGCPKEDVTPQNSKHLDKLFRASFEGVTKTKITISNIINGKLSPKYFDWRNYAVNGEKATQNGEQFVINTSKPDLWAQANAYQNKLIANAKNPLLRRLTFMKPFMAQYEEDYSSPLGATKYGITQSFTSDNKTIITLSFNGKILLAKLDHYANNRLTSSFYTLTDPKITISLNILSSCFSLYINDNQTSCNNLMALPFLPYNLDWNSATLSAPLSAAPATLSAGCQYQVALDQGSPKVLQEGLTYKISNAHLINNVWIPGQIGSGLKLVYFKPVMPPASEFDLLSVIKRNITEKNMLEDVFDLVGNTPEVKGIHKMILRDFRSIDQKNGIRQVRMRIIDLYGSPILHQIYSGQARLFDNSHDSKSISTEYYKTHQLNFPNRNQIR